jgi:heme a synthase
MLAFIAILLGAYTRLTNAGLSCPDWPHCYGFITAPHTTTQIQHAALNYPSTPVDTQKAWTEMTHRYFAGTEGILILIFAGSILFSRKLKDLKSVFIALLLIMLLIVQVMLGMLTVTEKLKPVIVLAHLLTGISILSTLWWAYLDVHLADDTFIRKIPTRATSWIWFALMLVALQISLGGWVSTHYAGLACVDFPYCNGLILPTLKWGQLNSDLITIHMLHRIGAVITATYVTVLALFLLRNPALRAIAILLIAEIALQLTLGILNILWLRPVYLALLHQAVAILLLLTTITALVKASLMKENRYGSWLA